MAWYFSHIWTYDIGYFNTVWTGAFGFPGPKVFEEWHFFFPQTAAMMIELHGDLLRIISLTRKTSEIFLFLVNLPTRSLAWGKPQGSYREWVLYNEKRNRSSSLPSCWFLYWNQFKKILIVAKLVVELYIWLLLYVFF